MKPQIIITIEGGVVQDVSSNVPIDYMTIDYDIGDYHHLITVPQDGGGTQEAIVSDCETVADKGVMKLVRNLRKQLNETK